MNRSLLLVVLSFVLHSVGCSKPAPEAPAPKADVSAKPTASAASPTATASATKPDDSPTFPITTTELVAKLRTAGFDVADPKPQNGTLTSIVKNADEELTFKESNGKLTGVTITAAKFKERTTDPRTADLIVALWEPLMKMPADQAKDSAYHTLGSIKMNRDKDRFSSGVENTAAKITAKPLTATAGVSFEFTPKKPK